MSRLFGSKLIDCLLCLAVLVGFMTTVGCESRPVLDQEPEKVEKRRQEFISQSQREADEALPPPDD